MEGELGFLSGFVMGDGEEKKALLAFQFDYLVGK